MTELVFALYDFNAQPNTSELSIKASEVLRLTNKDIGDGWWEGVNEHGQRGLFPACYVRLAEQSDLAGMTETRRRQLMVSSEPLQPENTYEHTYQEVSEFQQQQNGRNAQANNAAINLRQQSTIINHDRPSSYQSSTTTPQTIPSNIQNKSQQHNIQQNFEEPDWPDEDWDEEDSYDTGTEYSNAPPVGTPYYSSAAFAGANNAAQIQQHNNQAFGNVTQRHQADQLNAATSNLSIVDKPIPARPKKAFIRFSNSTKTSLEKYILDPKTIDVPTRNKVYIRNDQEIGITWQPSASTYNCTITTHGKETKVKVLKSFISYEIFPSTTNVGVRRRYKHFDWLMQRLEKKFIFSSLPPLPEKQISGRFQEEFVEHRRNILQLYANYIVRHPVLSDCEVWRHFIECKTDDLKGWKQGKRRFEKDELVGANFFHCVEISPDVPQIDTIKVLKKLDNFQQIIAKFDDAVKHSFGVSVELSKKFSSLYSKDYKRLSDSFGELARAFESGTAWRSSIGLNNALKQSSLAYDEISRLHEQEPKRDFEPMSNILHQYRGLLSGWPEVLQLHRHAINVRTEQEKLFETNNETGVNRIETLSRINQRTNVTTYVLLAEINHFLDERLVDFKQMMQEFLMQQINFHQEIVGNLQSALNKVNDA